MYFKLQYFSNKMQNLASGWTLPLCSNINYVFIEFKQQIVIVKVDCFYVQPKMCT